MLKKSLWTFVKRKPLLFSGALIASSLTLTNCGAHKKEHPQESLPSWAPGVGVNFSIDPLAISNEIKKAVEGPGKRQSTIVGICESAYYAVNLEAYKKKSRPFNIMVFNMAHNYSHGLKGVIYMKTFTYDGTTYGVWAFEDGWFENRGDGGYTNWCMMGWHNHQEGQGAKKVDFTRPATVVKP